MAIDGALREKLGTGTRLEATYKKETYGCEVVAGEDGKRLFRLDDGQEFKSPSAAGSALMGGIACNGWRFWSVAEEQPKPAPKPRRAKATKPAADEAADAPTDEAP